MNALPAAMRALLFLRVALAFALAGLAASPGAAESSASPLACPAVTVYVREGCPHCAAAEAWLAEAGERLPGLRVEHRDVGDPEFRAAFEAVNRGRHVQRPGVPTFAICDEVLVGFGEGSGALIEGLVTGRIAVVAGTFVAVSGLVYFAFMAAWLEVYFLIGFSRALQIALGALALLIGAVHVKDFFALQRGFSLSIPASVKPTLYQRMRAVVRAESLFAALGGVVVVAVLVNLVELLCTAGLPALYTQVLSYYPLGDAGYYGYLALYNVAYVADDALMVTIAVVTLGQHRLQERGGRWLKLLSGAVILVVGALLLFAPDMLVF